MNSCFFLAIFYMYILYNLESLLSAMVALSQVFTQCKVLKDLSIAHGVLTK